MAEQKLLPTFECSQKMRLSCVAALPRPAKWHSHIGLHARAHEGQRGRGATWWVTNFSLDFLPAAPLESIWKQFRNALAARLSNCQTELGTAKHSSGISRRCRSLFTPRLPPVVLTLSLSLVLRSWQAQKVCAENANTKLKWNAVSHAPKCKLFDYQVCQRVCVWVCLRMSMCVCVRVFATVPNKFHAQY